MAHRKLYRDTSIVVYKYGVQPLQQLPDDLWKYAKAAQNVWNNLVGIRQFLSDFFDQMELSGDEHKKQRIYHWEKFDKAWRASLRSPQIKNTLGSDEREFLTQKFETADKRAKDNKTGLKKHFGLERIYFRHRYSSGGKSLADFRKQNSLGFTFLFPDSDHYQLNTKKYRRNRIGKGVFGIVKDRESAFNFSFSAVIHREIPADAIVKSVSWVGKRTKGSGINKKHIHESQRDWCWSIDIACEVPNQRFPVQGKVRVAALDVGWRLSGDYLRLGATIDNSGSKLELRLPVSYPSNSARHGKLVSSIKELINIDERIGDLIQFTKDDLTKLGIRHLTKMREGGLFRLARTLAETGEDSQALELLEVFKAEYLPLRSIRARSFDRMNKYRDWLYQNLAAWLAKTYDVLIWEGKLNLKKMAEDRKNLNEVQTEEEKEREKIRRKPAKYRNYASIHGFRGYLKQAFAKRGKTIINGVTAYSSRTCSECKTVVEKFANVEFVCPNGHNFDRDFNAAQNLLNQHEGQFALSDVVNLNIPNLPHRNLSGMVVEVQ